ASVACDLTIEDYPLSISDQLTLAFTSIFNLSLTHSVICRCLKMPIIIPISKKTNRACLNDYRPVALMSVVMKCFENSSETSFVHSFVPDTPHVVKMGNFTSSPLTLNTGTPRAVSYIQCYTRRERWQGGNTNKHRGEVAKLENEKGSKHVGSKDSKLSIVCGTVAGKQCTRGEYLCKKQDTGALDYYSEVDKIRHEDHEDEIQAQAEHTW
ncbi:hypothetical protein P4O66_018586, partial [Electrophorus voltai]